MTTERKEGGVNLHVKWAEVIGFILFVAVMVPGVFFAGGLSQRLDTLETEKIEHEALEGHTEVANRVSVVESQYDEIIRRLKAIEDGLKAGR